MNSVRTEKMPVWLWRCLPSGVTAAIGACGVRYEEIEEICLRKDRQVTLTCPDGIRFLPVICSGEDLEAILLELCGGSLYAHTDEICEGYLLLRDGIRVGVGGRAGCEGDHVLGVHGISVLNVRLPHGLCPDVGILCRLLRCGRLLTGMLLFAPPGVGKTTCLRRLGEVLAGGNDPLRVVLADTRGELTPWESRTASCLSVLTGYPKRVAISIAVRTLSPQVVLCDEIGDREADAILDAVNSGVPLIASAHAADAGELLRRPGLNRLHRARVFGTYVGLARDGRGGFLFDPIPWEKLEARAVSDGEGRG